MERQLHTNSKRRRAPLWALIGGTVVIASIIATALLYDPTPPRYSLGLFSRDSYQAQSLSYLIAAMSTFVAMMVLVTGVLRLLPDAMATRRVMVVEYRSFVALRYLLVNPPRVPIAVRVAVVVGAVVWGGCRVLIWQDVGGSVPSLADPIWVLETIARAAVPAMIAIGFVRHSKPALVMYIVGLLVVGAALLVQRAIGQQLIAPDLYEDTRKLTLFALNIVVAVGAGLAVLALLFGSLRAFFTFFTTVPIGGVWIGTAALVFVLAVMSGFETDLRDKILGSNAHIQVTRDDGEFINWREAKQRIDKIPGVIASTPYASSEVVIAASGNFMNVIIKGIDPATVGGVTDLIDDLRQSCPHDDERARPDPEAIDRLQPLVPISNAVAVPAQPTPSSGIDPAPPDLIGGGEPIDFSGGAGSATDTDPGDGAPNGTGAGSAAGSGASTDAAHGAGSDTEPGAGAGSDGPAAPRMPGARAAEPPIVEPAPGDLEPPIAISTEEPSLSHRTQSLPGILVGCELVKQAHLRTNQEVRVVSPLADPSNPDATGTPIPYNRDFRVAGLFFTGMYEYDLKSVYVTLDALQNFLDLGDTIEGIEVRITDADETGTFLPKIEQALGSGYRIVDWRELNRSLFSALKVEKLAMFLVLGIVILVASFSIVGNLIMVVVEKAREIALLKTLGASDWGMVVLFAIQGLLIGVIGTVFGVSTGLTACWLAKKFGLPLNPDVYYIDRLPIHVDPLSVFLIAVAGVVISIAATLYPATLAARVRPAAGMRH
ncbi:MAG: FtsX-like permease family protein [Kofleriaceae bacterium]